MAVVVPLVRLKEPPPLTLIQRIGSCLIDAARRYQHRGVVASCEVSNQRAIEGGQVFVCFLQQGDEIALLVQTPKAQAFRARLVVAQTADELKRGFEAACNTYPTLRAWTEILPVLAAVKQALDALCDPQPIQLR